MLGILASIWLLHVAAMLSPGANVLLVSRLAAGDRARSAVFAALGVAVGAGLWSAFAVLGIDAVFAALPRLRLVLQIAGGLYLLLLASRLWRSRGTADTGHSQSLTAMAAFRMGLLTNITNPKAALFYGSVFAASFPADPSALLKTVYVVMIAAKSMLWHALMALAFSRERVRRAYARRQRLADRIAAAVFGALGLGLLAASLREAVS